MSKITRSPGIERAFEDVFPVPIRATRAPTASDTKFPLGQIWVRTDTAQAYILTQISGTATWALSSPGDSDVDTLAGDGGGPISPAGGNITLAGGTNITSAGAVNTITFNLNNAITLATSVTSALYTAGAGDDLLLTSVAGQDVIMKMGDNAGANKISFTDSDDAEVASIDSNGALTSTGITFTGLLTAAASALINTAGTALNLATDNSGDAVNMGTGNVIRAIGIANGGAVAHTVAIGSASAGAMTIDTAAGISLDSVTASNFTVTGAADLTLDSSAGSVNIAGGEAAADAVSIQAAAGGVDIDGALQINIDSAQAAATAIVMNTSDAAGGIDIDSGTGGMAMDSTGAISIDAAAASNFSVSGAGIDLSMISAAGRLVMNAEEAAADAISIQSAAGGMDLDVALQMNMVSSQAAANAIVMDASDAAGGIDIDSGTGGMAMDSDGAISIDAAAASNFSVSGAGIDLSMVSAAGRVIMNGEEAAANAVTLLSAAGGIDADCALQMNLDSSQAAATAIVMNASNAAGGVDVDAGTGGIAIDTTGVMSIDSAAASNFTVTGAFDLTLDSSLGSVNIDAGESAADAVVISASGANGGIQLQSGLSGVIMDSGLIMNVTAKTNADTPYAILGSDYFITTNTTANVLTVTLPAAPSTGRVIVVADGVGQAAANNITIDGNGKSIAAAGTTAGTKALTTAFSSMILTYNGTLWVGQAIA